MDTVNDMALNLATHLCDFSIPRISGGTSHGSSIMSTSTRGILIGGGFSVGMSGMKNITYIF